MPEELELDLELPRKQRLFAWIAGILMAVVAVLAFRESWLQGQRGAAVWLRAAFQLLQSWVLFHTVRFFDAHRLRVEDGMLQVLPQIHKVSWLRRWARASLRVPMAEAALEWIGPVLTLQNPANGLSVRLGFRKGSGRQVAEWLVARGARPPVGA